MAFTCSQCGYKNSEVRGGGAVPTYGTEVTLKATSVEDLKRYASISPYTLDLSVKGMS